MNKTDQCGEERIKRFFITKDCKIRWIKVFITKYIEWDDARTHLVVSMKNNMNEANCPKDCKIENVNIKNTFETHKEAQLEILLRERFD